MNNSYISLQVESTSTGKLETLKTRQDEVNTHISNLYLALRSLVSLLRLLLFVFVKISRFQLQVSEGQVKRELQNACNEQEEQLRTIQQLAEGEVSLISSSLDFIESQMASMSGNRSLQQKWDCYAHEIKQMLSNQDRKDSDTLKVILMFVNVFLFINVYCHLALGTDRLC